MSFWGNHHSIKKITWYKVSKVFKWHIMLISISAYQQTCGPNAMALLRLVLLTCLGSEENHKSRPAMTVLNAGGKSKKAGHIWQTLCIRLKFQSSKNWWEREAGIRTLRSQCAWIHTAPPAEPAWEQILPYPMFPWAWRGQESLWNLTAQSKSWLLHFLAVWPSENH